MQPSLFAGWLFQLIILNHIIRKHDQSKSFMITISATFLFILKIFYFYGSLCRFLEYFLEKKTPPKLAIQIIWTWPQCADFVIAWLPQDKRKCEHNIVRLVFVYILLSTCQWVYMALAIKRLDIYKIVMRNIYKIIGRSWVV